MRKRDKAAAEGGAPVVDLAMLRASTAGRERGGSEESDEEEGMVLLEGVEGAERGERMERERQGERQEREVQPRQDVQGQGQAPLAMYGHYPPPGYVQPPPPPPPPQQQQQHQQWVAPPAWPGRGTYVQDYHK